MKLLIIYQFCSFGGVERVILNRARTFKKQHRDISISVGYLRDYGALHSFQQYIQSHELQDCLSAFLLEDKTVPSWNQYDLVFNIDTPQVFEHMSAAKNVFMECHTPTPRNRQYLKALPKNIRGVIVPSKAFREILQGEFRKLPPIFVLPNPVTEDFLYISPSMGNPIYATTPLVFFARVDDELKNFSETARIFELFARHQDIMFTVVGRGAEDPHLWLDLDNKKILSRMLLRNQIDFDAAPAFIRMIKDQRGLFLSSSKAESFGLSAAEFISAGVPVLLSDISPHAELVDGNDEFLYPLGDVHSAKEKILKLLNQWDKASRGLESYGKKFNGVSFMAAWQEFLKAQNF